MSKFEHLNKRLSEAMTRDEFISAADDLDNAKPARKRIERENILLSVTGKSSERVSKKRILLHLQKDLQFEIEKHCVGNQNGILNYLIKQGIEALKAKNELIMIEAE